MRKENALMEFALAAESVNLDGEAIRDAGSRTKQRPAGC
jgi:hypothetical protein